MSEAFHNTKMILTTIAAVTGLMHQAEAHHLTPQEIVRAWEDPEYRQTLTEEQRALLPANPAGEIQFTPRAGNTLHFVTLANASSDNCSSSNCSSNNCSSSNCSSSNCSSDNCSSSNCSSNNCSSSNCSFGIS